jgi:hypothetical protein
VAYAECNRRIQVNATIIERLMSAAAREGSAERIWRDQDHVADAVGATERQEGAFKETC